MAICAAKFQDFSWNLSDVKICREIELSGSKLCIALALPAFETACLLIGFDRFEQSKNGRL